MDTTRPVRGEHQLCFIGRGNFRGSDRYRYITTYWH